MTPELQNAFVQFFVMLLLAFLSAAIPLAGRKLYQVANALVARYQASTTSAQRNVIAGIIRTAVQAAEQTGVVDGVKVAGAAKKADALQRAQELLDQHGIHVDAAALDSEIEAMVFSDLTQFKDLPGDLLGPALPAPAAGQ